MALTVAEADNRRVIRGKAPKQNLSLAPRQRWNVLPGGQFAGHVATFAPNTGVKKNVVGNEDVNNQFNGYGTGGAAKVLDQVELDALTSLLGRYDTDRKNAKRAAQLTRDAEKNKKEAEFGREKGKYEGKKLSTLQDFGGTKTETDLNVRNTLENLVSSLSTMGMGGSRALARQILAAANQSNRKANATQATNNRELDSSFNEYEGGYKDDVAKIDDQYNYQSGLADKEWAENRQGNLYKQAGVYGDVDDKANRERLMSQGNSLNSVISNSAFLNPKYTGEARAMATPELADYTQDIAQYNTAGVGAGADGMPGNSANTPGNLAIKAVALNNKDFGVKKKTEGDLAYGV